MKALRIILTLLVVLTVVAGLWRWAWKLSQPLPEVLQGQMEATVVNVSAKIPGRVSSILVREGQTVRKADPLVTLESPEIQARLDQAEAARQAASAQRDKAFNGAREEEIRQAENMWERAQHGTELAEKTFRRVDRLNKDGVVPAQRRDEAEAQLKTARDAEAVAKAAYDMAASGARAEDKATATALVSRARGAISEVQAYLGETKVSAPIAGEVYKRNAEPGEIVAAGYPILTILDPTDTWATFQLREDKLAGLKIGGHLTVRVPALSDRRVELQVSYVAPAGDFATWRATNAQGGFDLKTFEVRARPLQAVDGLRPGMSVILVNSAGR
ncbi:MAG TPA: efflux RND transporter periplasmic adaptor subunit [Vicinamibacterales bacterium]|jgi:HlyD family secretion protein